MKIPAARWIGTAVAGAALATGCVTYSPQQLSGMSGIDLCEVQAEQSFNLAAETRQAIQAELSRRNETCMQHSAELTARRDERMHQLVYGIHDDP
jgi:hypothetical protein